MSNRTPLLAGTILLAACLDNSGPDDSAVARLEILGDTALQGVPGETLAGELRVRVTDHRGEPLSGIAVTWTTFEDGGALAPDVVPTDRDGIARSRWTLGSAPGVQAAQVSVAALDPVALRANAAGFTAAQLSAGTGEHICALDAGGTAFCWGTNRGGELGDGTTENSERPVRVAGNLRFTQLTTGQGGTSPAGFTCGLATTGEVYCWGGNQVGELGDGGIARFSSEPRPIAVPAGTRFAALSSFAGGTCGVTTIGEAYCWGGNSHGRFGNGAAGGIAQTPTLVGGGLRWRQVVLGDDRACGIASDATTWCWGGFLEALGFDPALGTVTTPQAFNRGPAFDSLSLSWYSQCGTRTGAPHAAFCWGHSFHVGTAITSSRYVTTPGLVAAPTLFRTIKAANMTQFGLSIDGHLYMWGNYWHDHGSPGAPIRMTTNLRLSAIGTRGSGACGIEDQTSTVYCWRAWNPGEHPRAVPPAE